MTCSCCYCGIHYRYTAGDHVAMYPENDADLVERIGELLEVNLDQVFSLVNKDGVCVFVWCIQKYALFYTTLEKLFCILCAL